MEVYLVEKYLHIELIIISNNFTDAGLLNARLFCNKNIALKKHM